ncbi:MAG: PDZ domain-containing protein [Planctomycetes bacterium]|nr:PDZ domain-containing protein [Planctomycetota bacterium]
MMSLSCTPTERKKPVRNLILAGVVACSSAMVASSESNAQDVVLVEDDKSRLPEATQPSEEQIKKWIEELASENYAARESASRRISRHLTAALPLVLESAESAKDSNAEQLLQFLGFVASEAFTEPGMKAYASLERIANDRTTHRAVVAQRILESISVQMRDLAIDRLSRVGITVETRYLSVLTRTIEVRNALVIDSRFSGKEEDLVLLKWVFDVQFVKLDGPHINHAILNQVSRMSRLNSLQIIDTTLQASDLECLLNAPDLKLLEILYTPIDDSSIAILEQLPVFGDMQLFGTKISAQGAKDLVARIDSANVFVGRGGFLGIQCEPSSLIIREVVPNGPADRSGIRNLDKLLRIDGVSISNFDELRRELAKSADGEKVVVEFERPVMTFRRPNGRGNGPDGPRLDAYSPMKVEVTLGRRPSELNR